MIEVKALEKSFKKTKVLDKIDLLIPQGKIVAILGPNGSGKTTLIKCIMGMVKPDKGEMLMKAQLINDQSTYRSNIDYLPQISRHPENLTANELVEMLEDIRGQKGNAQFFIKLFDLEPYLGKRLGNLSGGTRQKVSVLLSLMFQNEVMMLDEPTNGLDPVAIIRLKDYLNAEKSNGKTIVFTTHIIPLVEEIADEIIFLLDGRIYFQGSAGELKLEQQEDSLERAIANILTDKKDIINV